MLRNGLLRYILHTCPKLAHVVDTPDVNVGLPFFAAWFQWYDVSVYLFHWLCGSDCGTFRYHLPKNANFTVELAKICWPSSLPAVPKKEAANSTCRNTIAVKSTKHKLSLRTHGLLPTRDLISGAYEPLKVRLRACSGYWYVVVTTRERFMATFTSCHWWLMRSLLRRSLRWLLNCWIC